MDEATREKYGDLEWAQDNWLRPARAWVEHQSGGSHPLYRPEVADTVPYGLQRFLEHGPVGTWRRD